MLTVGANRAAMHRIALCRNPQMSRFWMPLCIVSAVALGFLAASSSAKLLFKNPDSVSAQGQSASSSNQGSEASSATARLTRGKKLVLKDGNFQLVREYDRKGERVRYFSLERGAWEEIQASMIDWAAAEKVEAATAARDKAEVEKLKKQEETSRVDRALDVDASLQAASGMFLASGEGMFAVEG